MNNTLTQLFLQKKERILNVYCTAGFPALDSTVKIIEALQQAGADIIEIGMPYSDPLADGPVIQQSNLKALQNGMTISLLFEQLQQVKKKVTIPLILMGYYNPVMQYGLQKFCEDAAAAGIAGIILPDLPTYEYEKMYKSIFEKNGLSFIFLITPQTSEARIRQADKLSSGFLYAVSSSATTGGSASMNDKVGYFAKLQFMKLKNPLLIGFGINNADDFDTVCKYASGAVVGSAYIKAIAHVDDEVATTETFVKNIKG